MSVSPSRETWERALAEAMGGAPRNLLELLLSPTQVDNKGAALPGAFYALPDDEELRHRIVRALVFGPWSGATTIAELMTRTGWGRTKPKLHEMEVAAFDLLTKSDADEDELEAMADALGQRLEVLRKRIAAKRRAKT